MIAMPTKERKPRKLILSPTKIRSWLECRLQYKFTYIGKLSRFYYKPNVGDTFGSTMHRVLEAFHSAGGAQSVGQEQLVEILQTQWVSTGYASVEEEQAHAELGQQIVLRCYEDAQAVYVAESESCIPAPKMLFTEKQLRHDFGDFVLMGRLDRLDQHSDGMLEIIDYKSGRLSVDESEVHDSLPMAIYALLVTKHFPGVPVIASIEGLAGKCRASTSFTANELEALEWDVREVARQIVAVEEYLPTYGPVCEDCIYARLCYKKGPVDWERKLNEMEG